MGRLEAARLRLEQAIDRLDGAVSRRLGEAGKDDPPALRAALAKVEDERDTVGSDLEALRADHRKLAAALREAQENYAASQVVTEAVAGRLETAIDQLEVVLES